MNSRAVRRMDHLKASVAPLRRRLLQHPFDRSIGGLEDVRLFMEHHVYAVWDFMTLLKSLQHSLTCIDTVWVPVGDAVTRRLINEIVLGEESDHDHVLGTASHFEMYRRSMALAGARTDHVDAFVLALEQGTPVRIALEEARAPWAAQQFALSTWRLVESASLPAIAGAFTIGRESLIPDLFRSLMVELRTSHPDELGLLTAYMDRHIEVDGDEHEPMAAEMLSRICESDPLLWRCAAAGAEAALRQRIELWDGIARSVEARRTDGMSQAEGLT